ncbi:Abi family protein [Alishewanella aestuarii B11]|uniref:Abi family protein n=1 Tax=Alishewanella aestuarii B11 TaxID=1197174 RepID=J2IE91_9ALTE|nr:Abi family protein [Alishewanella aestuarii]EJI85482.1 Abi family protein [Alishewanella aestuarii B11]
MPYSKPWLSYNEQLALLESRGLLITDRAAALEYLERIGYYRLSGYWYAFRERSGELVLLDNGKKPKNPKSTTMFSGMREKEQDAISALYGLSNGRVFASWLRSLNYLRNVCAHHSRLWNRNIIDQPKLPDTAEVAWIADFTSNNHAIARCFLLLKICQHLLLMINPSSTSPAKMREQLLDFPDLAHIGLDLKGMGVTADWTNKW